MINKIVSLLLTAVCIATDFTFEPGIAGSLNTIAVENHKRLISNFIIEKLNGVKLPDIPFGSTAENGLASGISGVIGSSTPFIEYMLNVVNDSLHTMLDFKSRVMSTEDRLAYFSEIRDAEFSRKDYMSVFKEISSATASRDLKQGVELGLFVKEGDKTKTIYRIIK